MVKTAKNYIELVILTNKENKNIIFLVYGSNEQYGREFKNYDYDYNKLISNKKYSDKIVDKLLEEIKLDFKDVPSLISIYTAPTLKDYEQVSKELEKE